jgi:molybdopterin converting factor small subunit
VFHARCVLEVVDEATTGNLLGKLKEQLPAEYERLFSAGSTGRMPS